MAVVDPDALQTPQLKRYRCRFLTRKPPENHSVADLPCGHQEGNPEDFFIPAKSERRIPRREPSAEPDGPVVLGFLKLGGSPRTMRHHPSPTPAKERRHPETPQEMEIKGMIEENHSPP